MDQLQAIEGGELLLLNVDASSPRRIHRGREPPETARICMQSMQRKGMGVMATADFEALACLEYFRIF